MLQTEQELTARVAEQLFARCGVQVRCWKSPAPAVWCMSSHPGVGAGAPDARAVRHHGQRDKLADRPGLIRCQTCVSAYISTAFLCGGTVTDPQKEYNLEFLTGRTNLAKDFEALLAEHEFAPHRTRRNGVNLIYVKSSASVERILAFMGAAEASAG